MAVIGRSIKAFTSMFIGGHMVSIVVQFIKAVCVGVWKDFSEHHYQL